MRLNSGGKSINILLYVSGIKTLNNAATLNSPLYVGSTSILQGNFITNSAFTASNQLTLINNVWHKSADGTSILMFKNGTTYFHSGNAGSEGLKLEILRMVILLLKPGNVATTEALNITGAVTCLTINATGGNSFLAELGINGGDTCNTIYQATEILA